ncbi:Bifunctional TH2 protein, mitochondrial [Linum perenne]
MSSSAISSPSATAPGRNSEDGLAAKLWIKSCRQLHFAMYTPFVVCLASGNLKIESFRHYIAQDFHFLEPSLEWGIDPAKEVLANSATVRYTEFLLDTASGKVEGVKGPGKLATPFERTKLAAYTLGAMAPCMRLYAFLGKELQAFGNTNNGNHPYKKWIENYSCDGFQASALQTEDLLDKLAVSLTGEELDVIEKLYHQAMKLETEFFSAQPILQPILVPLTKEHNPDKDRLVIFSDFDLTCTVVDSSAVFAEIAIVTAPKSDQLQPENQIPRMSSAELRNTWGLLSTQYMEEYQQCIESVLPSGKAGGLGVLSVHANELLFEESITTGEIVNNMETPLDKVQAFRNIMKNYEDDKMNLTVYIGDSVGDLLCLLEADVGIVIGSSSSLRTVGSRLRVSFVPLFPGVLQKQRECTEESCCSMGKKQCGTLYTVYSWAEIDALILGHD